MEDCKECFNFTIEHYYSWQDRSSFFNEDWLRISGMVKLINEKRYWEKKQT